MHSPDFKSTKATSCGLLAIVLWSPGAIAVTQIIHLPIFEIMAINFSTAWCALTIWLRQKHLLSSQHMPANSKPIWLLYALCILSIWGTNLFMLKARQLGDVARVNLVFYSWPLWLMLAILFIQKTRVRWFHILKLFDWFYGYVYVNRTTWVIFPCISGQ